MAIPLMAGASLGLGLIGMFGGKSTANAQARAQIAQINASVAISKANTEAANAQSSLANHLTALNNSRIAKQYEKSRAALGSNQWNQRDQRTSTKLETGLRQAEQAGTLVANMAFSGSGGASFEAIESSMRLRNARVNQNTKDVGHQLNYAMAQDMAGLTESSLSQLDMTVHSGTTDNTVVQTPVTGGTNWASAISQSGMLDTAAKLIPNLGSGSTTYSLSNLGAGNLGLNTAAGGLGLSSSTASTSFFNLSSGNGVSLW